VGNQDGSREVLDGSGGGWTGSPGDLDGQASYLRALRSDGRLLVSERGAARRRAESVFGFDGFATATSRILRETVVG